MKSRMALLFVVSFVVAIAGGCDKLKGFSSSEKTESVATTAPAVLPVRGAVIAKVNNIPITLDELNQEVEAFNAMVPAEMQDKKITTREQKLNYLKEQMVRTLLLYQEALDKRLDSNEEVQRILEKTKRELLVVQFLKQEAEKIDVTSQEIEEFYNQNKARLKEPEERRLREIVLRNEQEAKDILIQLLQGGDFAALARERSIAATAKDAGAIGFILPGTRNAQFDAAAFSSSLDVGQVSSIFKTPEGYAIVKVEEKKGGKEKSLTELWDDIKRTLTYLKQRQKMEELVGKLSTNAKIEIYEGEVK